MNIDSKEDKEVYLRVRADEQSKFVLNGEEIYFKDSYTVEEDIKAKLKKGQNKLEVRLSWKSPRPYTGREFGVSVQVLDEHKKIEKTIKAY